MKEQAWQSVPYLDTLRPAPGWRTEYALLASYSADLVALVAALLSLAGLDDDRGSGSKVDFANAVEQLKGRVRLVSQAGRLGAPAKTQKILAILDRYVREVRCDEESASWHPKAALVKQRTDDGARDQWRLWIGSRNLTRDMAWDIGLTLVGDSSSPGGEVAGVAELGHELAARAELPEAQPARVRAELKKVRWRSPSGCAVTRVDLHTDAAGRALPAPPADLERLIVISPFLDGTVVGKLGAWGGEQTRRELVSTLPELAKLARQAGRPLEGYTELFYLDAPAPEGIEKPDDESTSDSEDEEIEARGLHAKLILAEHAAGRTLWTGSANATQRGWLGPNSEVIARAEVGREVADGLSGFVHDIAKTVRLDELPVADEADPIEERLELARKQVARTWSVTQQLDEGEPILNAEESPHPTDSQVTLSVGTLTGTPVEWPRGTRRLRLPRIAPSEVTELVACQLKLAEKEVAWLQRAPLDPPPDDERDRQALARYLDPRTFLLWIRSLLTGDPLGDGGGDWDGDREARGAGPTQSGPVWWAPTLEEVLKAWSRDPESLAAIDRKVQHYLKLYQEQKTNERTAEEQRVVDEFYAVWQTVRGEMVRGRT